MPTGQERTQRPCGRRPVERRPDHPESAGSPRIIPAHGSARRIRERGHDLVGQRARRRPAVRHRRPAVLSPSVARSRRRSTGPHDPLPIHGGLVHAGSLGHVLAVNPYTVQRQPTRGASPRSRSPGYVRSTRPAAVCWAARHRTSARTAPCRRNTVRVCRSVSVNPASLTGTRTAVPSGMLAARCR